MRGEWKLSKHMFLLFFSAFVCLVYLRFFPLITILFSKSIISKRNAAVTRTYTYISINNSFFKIKLIKKIKNVKKIRRYNFLKITILYLRLNL